MNDIIITKLYNKLKASHPDDAAEVLLELLISGNVPALAFDPQNDDNIVRLDQHHWQSLGAQRAEQIFQAGKAPVKQDMRYGPADFQMHILVPAWSLDLLPEAELTHSTPTGNKRGPRPAIDWSVVWTGAAYLMSQSKKPQNLEELVRETSSWCGEHFGDEAAPGDTVLKEAFSGLFKLISGAEPNTVFPKGTKPKRNRKRAPAKRKGAGR